MNNKKSLTYTIVILTLGLSLACNFLFPPQTAQIVGYVFRSDLNKPEELAVITLYAYKPNNEIDRVESKILTDENGNFSFDEVRPGRYGLTVEFDSACASDSLVSSGDWLVIAGDGLVLLQSLELFNLEAGDIHKKNLTISLKGCP